MKKTKQLGLIVITFVALLFLQNCTSEVEREELEAQENTVSNTDTTFSRINPGQERLYFVEVIYPAGEGWVSNQSDYVNEPGELVESITIQNGMVIEFWQVFDRPPFDVILTRPQSTKCIGCPVTETVTALPR